MTELLHSIFALLAGFALGLVFFVSLWWTVQRVASRQASAWWLPLGSLVRTALLVTGFCGISQGHLTRLTACFAGWIVARQFTLARYGPGTRKEGGPCT